MKKGDRALVITKEEVEERVDMRSGVGNREAGNG